MEDFAIVEPNGSKNFIILNGEFSRTPFNLNGNDSDLTKVIDLDGGSSRSRSKNHIKILDATLLWLMSLSAMRLLLFGIFFLLSLPIFSALYSAYLIWKLAFPSKNETNRKIQWDIHKFDEEIKSGLIVSHPINDISGEWRLVIKQKRQSDWDDFSDPCNNGHLLLFGLLAVDLNENIENTKASIQISCFDQEGKPISTFGSNLLEFKRTFAKNGDAFFSRPIFFTDATTPGDFLQVKSILKITRVEMSPLQLIWARFNHLFEAKTMKRSTTDPRELGRVIPHTERVPRNGNGPQTPIETFLRNPETKSFTWIIPHFATVTSSSLETWSISSPQFFVISNDFCSIWRLRLVDVEGVLRLHLQLRGLPDGVKRIRSRLLIRILDNFGDSIIPELSINRIDAPEFLNMWHELSETLYSRDILCESFTDSEGSLKIQLSLLSQIVLVPKVRSDFLRR